MKITDLAQIFNPLLDMNKVFTQNRPFIGSRFHQTLLLGAAVISLFLGLSILLAWHLHLTAIIQMIPNAPPTRYNTGLAFLFSGLAFLLILQRRSVRKWASVFSALVTLIGVLTLSQYILKIDLGIDQLLMRDSLTPLSWNQRWSPYSLPHQNHLSAHQPVRISSVQQFLITIDRPLPGRPSPNVSLGFTFVGITLLCLGKSHDRPRNTNTLAKRSSRLQNLPMAVATTLAAGVIGLSTIAILGYVAQLSTTSTGRYVIGVDVLSAIGLMVLGGGLFLVALNHPRVLKNPRWISLSAGLGVVIASLFLWQALVSWSQPLNGSTSVLEIEALLTPIANIVLLGGILSALLVTAVLYFVQITRKQTDQLRRSTEEVIRSQLLLQSTLEATADGILVVTTQWEIKYFNHQFIDLWQVPESIVASMKRGDSSEGMNFGLSLLKDPEGFLRATQAGMSQLESESFDVVEFKDGRIFERYFRPYWMNETGTLHRKIVGKVLSYRDITTQKKAETALQESESRFQAFINNSPTVVFMKDEQGRYVYVNETLERSFNVKSEVLLGQTDFDWLPKEIAKIVTENDATVLATQQTLQYAETVPAPDGRAYHWLTLKFPFRDQAGHRYVGGIAIDITERQQMEETLFQEKELAQVTLDSIGDAVITTDAIGQIRYLNPVAEVLTGWREQDAQGIPLTQVFKIFHETTRVPVENPIEIALREDRIVELANHTILIARDGREIAIDDSAAPIHDRSGQIVGAVLVFHDVTHNRELSRKFSWQAKHDPLTGLINRREFEQRLEGALTSARVDDQIHALCYMDLDQFKIVNDTCGHVAGDELLRQVTMLLQEQIRKSDTLARLGGDEFGVLLMQCPLEQAIAVSNALREKVQAFRFIWQGNSFAIGVSIGLVGITAESESLANLLIAADTACYAAKNNGRNRIHVFQRDDQDLLQYQGDMRWVNRLTKALEEDRFVLQGELMAAIDSLESNQIHYEVLIRLQDEDGKLVSPMAFIPAAERYNLMEKIDRWVIKKVFSNWAILQHKQQSPQNLKISVVYAINLSGASINDPQFTEFLHQQFDKYAVSPELICFEITETVAIANLTKASQFIAQFQQLGCRFALDDFGSGMSSFGYLKNLPVNYLKIDGEFIRNMVNDPVDYAMVEAINHIGHVMGIKTIAEWVEDDEILERVKTLGINYAQGYAMGKTCFLC